MYSVHTNLPVSITTTVSYSVWSVHTNLPVSITTMSSYSVLPVHTNKLVSSLQATSVIESYDTDRIRKTKS